MMLVVLVLISLSSLVLTDDVIKEPTQEETTALKSYIATLDSLSGDTLRSLIKLNNSIPALVKNCEKNEKLVESQGQTAPAKIKTRVQNVNDALEELAFAVKELHYKSVDIMKLAIGTSSVQLASEVSGLRGALNKCEKEKEAEIAERVKCEEKLPKIQSELDKVKTERDECKAKQKQLQNELKKCLEDNSKEKTNLENELRTLREKCNKDNSDCDKVKTERDECVRKAKEDRIKYDKEMKKCKDESGGSITGIQAQLDACKSRDEECNKTKLERDQCQSELDKTKGNLTEIIRKCEVESDKLNKCEDEKKKCEESCQDAKKRLNKKLKECTATVDDLQSKLNGTNSEVDRLKSEVERLNASLSTCNDSEMPKILEPDTTTPQTTTLPPTTTTQPPPTTPLPPPTTTLPPPTTTLPPTTTTQPPPTTTLPPPTTTLPPPTTTLPPPTTTLPPPTTTLPPPTTTLPPPTTTLPAANLVPGCEAFEIASNIVPVISGESSFIIGKRQYVINTYYKHSWQKSRDICSSRGMTLLQLETQAEFMSVIPKIRSLFPSNTVQPPRWPNIWLGGERIGTVTYNPKFRWVCGGTPLKLVNFPGVPGNFLIFQNAHPCVNVYVPPQATGGLWYGLPCDTQYFYACEKPLL